LCREEHAKAIDKAVFPFTQGGPLMHAVAAKAVALKEAASAGYQAYAAQVIANAGALAKSLEAEGMRAVSGGTDTHLALLDLRPLGVTGAEAEVRCDAARITLNKNAVPYDPAPPLRPSGIRVGSPSLTTQGMTEDDMAEVGRLVARAVRAEHGTEAGDRELAAVAEQVSALVARAPAYPRG
ncbi:MAG: serine hydroxymethyltransferase, partial [Pseudonocardia sp.]|nr:serine hydroxymethyltransferase [Pseudonocardia sp.]